MNLNQYQADAVGTRQGRTKLSTVAIPNVELMALGLAAEAGEVANLIVKAHKDDGGVFTDKLRTQLSDELGDVLWYLSNLAAEMDYPLNDLAMANLEKLRARYDNRT